MCSIGFPPETMVMQAVATLHKRGHKFEELQENRVPSQNPDRGCSMASCNPLNKKCAHKFETIWICFNKGGCRPLFKGSPETAPQSPRSPVSCHVVVSHGLLHAPGAAGRHHPEQTICLQNGGAPSQPQAFPWYSLWLPNYHFVEGSRHLGCNLGCQDTWVCWRGLWRLPSQ